MRYRANKKVSCWRQSHPDPNRIHTKNNMSPSPSVMDMSTSPSVVEINICKEIAINAHFHFPQVNAQVYGNLKLP